MSETTTWTEADTAIAQRVGMDVDLDAVVPCETWNEPCDRPAAWLVVQPCCNDRATLCSHHHDRKVRQIEGYLASHGGFRCGHCGAVPAPMPIWSLL